MNLTLNAKTTLAIGPFTGVQGDVASSGAKGSVLFDVSSSQGSFFSLTNTLANTVTVRSGASVGHVFGNDITVDGTANQQSLGLNPAALPQVPAPSVITPGTTNVTVKPNQAKQLCPGQFGAISLGTGATLSLNGGVYQMTRLTLADGARLEPSEPVVILITGTLTTGVSSAILPSAQALNPMTAADIRIEAGGNITLGDSSQIRAHLLAPNSKLTTGKSVGLTGAGWAKSISIGSNNFVSSEGVFSLIAPTVPPPCNDNNLCTADRCVTTGSLSMCTNTPVPSGASCEDGNLCNGAETCDGAGTCLAGSSAPPGTACTDGNACNGDETCDGLGTCDPGTPPTVSDGNSCTADACDAVTGVSHIPLPDGTRCNGLGTCQAGTCSVQGALFSQTFTSFEEAPTQCTAWRDFVNNDLSSSGSYNSVTISGTFNPTGTTCSDPTAATAICQAMNTGNFADVFCDGHVWTAGTCDGDSEVSIDTGGLCFCEFFDDAGTVRPCENINWGGVNTETCEAPSQTMTVLCE